MAIWRLPRLLVTTTERWVADGAFSRSASLAYYALFSLAPLVVIITVLVGAVYSGDTVLQVRSQFAQIVSPEAADLIAGGVVHAGERLEGGVWYAVLAAALMLIGVSAFTSHLQQAVEGMWNVEARGDRGYWETIKDRFRTLSVVFATGIVLQVSVLVSSVAAVYFRHIRSVTPGTDMLWPWLDHGVSFVLIAAILALVYRFLPNATLRWTDIAIGSTLTAVLLTVGKWAIALYLSRSGFQSLYGAAGSLMVILAWLYYSSLILLFGAEFTQVWVESHGDRIQRRDIAARSS